MRSRIHLSAAFLAFCLTGPVARAAPRDEYTEDTSFKCFESNAELKKAVKRYERHNVVDMELAELYGWPIGLWCVKGLEDFSEIFQGKTDFNEDLSMWDVSAGKSFRGMFSKALSFDQEIGMWDMQNAEDISRMFQGAKSFNRDISYWQLSSVTKMDYAFNHALAFNQDVSRWDLRNVDSQENAFVDARSLSEKHRPGNHPRSEI